MNDPVDHPKHYNSHESGVEAIEVCEHLNFCAGNAVKYVWRAGEKGNRLEDLKKARWYLQRQFGHQFGHQSVWLSLRNVRLQESLKKIWEPRSPTFLGMFLWTLATENIQQALVLIDEEIKRSE